MGKLCARWWLGYGAPFLSLLVALLVLGGCAAGDARGPLVGGGRAGDGGRSGGGIADAAGPLDSGMSDDVLPGGSCEDGVLNGLETGVDCGGGQCAPCEAGAPCVAYADCASGVCWQGLCRDVDCSVVTCPAGDVCYRGACYATCSGQENCEPTDRCYEGRCAPTDCEGVWCPDGEVCYRGACYATCQNDPACPAETSCRSRACVDPCENAVCPGGQQCYRGACYATCAGQEACDPQSRCFQGSCLPRDCQGVQCREDEQCVEGACLTRCAGDGDCPPSGALCQDGVCVVEDCVDGLANGQETGVDCGGPECGACPSGESCAGDGDCARGLWCLQGRCEDPCGAVSCAVPERSACLEGRCHGACAGDGDCALTERCHRGACVPLDCEGVQCRSDEQCHQGACMPVCAGDPDCAGVGGRCLAGVCALDICAGLAPAQAQEVARCGPGPVELVAEPPQGANSARWYDAPQGGALIGEGLRWQGEVGADTTLWLAAYNTFSGCESPARVPVAVVVRALPGPVAVAPAASVQCGGAVELVASGGAGGAIYWQGVQAEGVQTDQPGERRTVSQSGTYHFRARSAEGCWGPEALAEVTIHPVPGAVAVAGGGPQCGGTRTLTASGGEGGAIYWQGTTAGGTSTASLGASQSVGQSGTYHFRARSPEGCWGPQGSAVVAIHPVPGAVAVSGGGDQCQGVRRLVASGGEGGTVYWQGPWSGGTSTLTPTTVADVGQSGTYYFRSHNAQGCWGAEGAAAVSIRQIAPKSATWMANWSASYDGNSNLRANTTFLYQGYYSENWGHQRSQIGFDDGDIRARLGVWNFVDVQSVEVYLYFQHWGPAVGGKAHVGLHSNNNRPATFANKVATTNINGASFARDQGRWLTAPGAWHELWRTGGAKGVTIGPAPDNTNTYYGYAHGHTETNPPRLRVNWRVCE